MSKKGLSGRVRWYRKYHRQFGVVLLAFVILSSATGLLLSWKKDVSLIQPPTQKGQAQTLSEWKSLDELATIASDLMPNNQIDRLDIRPDKGIVKVIFVDGSWEVQLDGATGEVLSHARRHSDWIEQLHDLSIISDGVKLVTMNLLAFGLLVLGFSGFWLYFGPKLIRKRKLEK